jgi:hypothetical protein
MNFEKLNNEWRLIDGFDDYAISRSGIVMNDLTGRQMKPYLSNVGYLNIKLLTNEGLLQHQSIHRLVAKAFLVNTDMLPHIDHIDRNKRNNNVDNLRWSSVGDNQRNKLKYHSYNDKSTTSQFKGVSYNKSKKWNASIRINGSNQHIGCFVDELEAANAWNEAMYNHYEIFVPNVLPNLLTV